ncbi:CadC family transcriptional regulator [Salmonella enterica subsp. enterica]|uniref:CadC family transcriptional regulator n=2 Tax=Salmonella enterica TaxID=28901 RepID=A0A744KGI0_SALER|nr:transcriptional regulator CadC [Salmonella enterica subsp. enterica serovar Aqua]ECH1172331.1 CadC family transcriptional regulator [Salmonella enterica subsp. enterica serovar Aqua]HAF2609466.1 CadC family transcriptional regulator [Salmonella enterica]
MQPSVIRIGDWLVTPSVNQISCQDCILTLEPRLIDLLMYFAQHPGRVLSRDEIIDNIWIRNFVTNHAVTQSISKLRNSLKSLDEEGKEYIITVPKRGYKLVAPVISCVDDGMSINSLLSTEVGSSETADWQPVHPIEWSSVTGSELRDKNQSDMFCTWFMLLLSIGILMALVLLSITASPPQLTKTQLLLNPHNIDIRFESGKSCNNWSSQQAYITGFSNLITTSLNTYTDFSIYDKTNLNFNIPSSAGKKLTMKFINQRHYRAQQCFMLVLLVNNADGSTMLNKRYFITSNNLLSIQNDLLRSLFSALEKPWPLQMQKRQGQFSLLQSQSIAKYYHACQFIMDGNAEKLGKASDILGDVIEESPDFTKVLANKGLVDVLLSSLQIFNEEQQMMLKKELNEIERTPGIKTEPAYYQMKSVEMIINKGNTEEALEAINKSIEIEVSWLNYVLLGKIYEMAGEARLAADAYLTAYNLRPGYNTLYWIENGVFHSSVEKMVPYLETFLSSP